MDVGAHEFKRKEPTVGFSWKPSSHPPSELVRTHHAYSIFFREAHYRDRLKLSSSPSHCRRSGSKCRTRAMWLGFCFRLCEQLCVLVGSVGFVCLRHLSCVPCLCRGFFTHGVLMLIFRVHPCLFASRALELMSAHFLLILM